METEKDETFFPLETPKCALEGCSLPAVFNVTKAYLSAYACWKHVDNVLCGLRDEFQKTTKQ